jgi:hypothetical protein
VQTTLRRTIDFGKLNDEFSDEEESGGNRVMGPWATTRGGNFNTLSPVTETKKQEKTMLPTLDVRSIKMRDFKKIIESP